MRDGMIGLMRRIPSKDGREEQSHNYWEEDKLKNKRKEARIVCKGKTRAHEGRILE